MKDVKIFENIKEWMNFRNTLDASLGIVPTMGALHAGHSSLIKKSTQENKYTLVSIYINPTQFDDQNDFKNYPQSLDQDISLIKASGADFVLIPKYSELYPDDFKYQIEETSLSKILCGASRPGHFRGMLTVVMKLLQLAQASRAYFGEKDFQQYLLIKGMTEAFFLKTEIVPCKTIREEDGLAMSSRNVRLNLNERRLAALFPKLLKESRNAQEARKNLIEQGINVDYVEERQGRRFAAVKIGHVRLIDNVET